MNSKRRKRGERYPVEYVAREFGVDRAALLRRLEAKNIDTSGGITFRQAFSAWTAKDERDADRARQQKAEADTAEITAAEKSGKLMLRKDAQLLWADLTIELRKLIQSKPTWKAAELLTAMAKIKTEVAK